MSSPKYIRVHLDRFGSDTEEYNLWYCLGMVYPDFTNPLFPNSSSDLQHPYYPRKAIAFNEQKYVDIPMEQSSVVSFYINRKDGYHVYNGEISGTEGIETGGLDPFKYETGYMWTVDVNVNPQSEVFIKEGKPYVYKDNTYNGILSFGISTVGSSDDELDEDETAEQKTMGNKYRIFYDFKNYFELDIPEEASYELWGDTGREPSEFQMLYLKGKSFNNIGEDNMDLSLSAEALQEQKDDAKQMLESAIANSLYKIGEDVDDFDENAFLADVTGFKAGKDISFNQTIDYLKVCIDNLNTING
jgi:hypothetical protein